MESKCTFTPVCGVTCDKCPAKIKFKKLPDSKLSPIHALPECKVMIAVIQAFQAQEDYWNCKLEIEQKEILSQVDDIAARLDSVEGKIKDIMRNSEQGKIG